MSGNNKVVHMSQDLEGLIFTLSAKQDMMFKMIQQINSKLQAQPIQQPVQQTLPVNAGIFCTGPHDDPYVKVTKLKKFDLLSANAKDAYYRDLEMFKRRHKLFIEVMKVKNQGYSFTKIHEQNKDKLPKGSISSLYSMFASLRRAGYIIIANKKFAVTAKYKEEFKNEI